MSSTSSASTADLEARFKAVTEDWARLTSDARRPDEERFANVKAEADAIVTAGRWTSGPSDLLKILGRHRDELMHSRLIGWLLSPTGRHGLGKRFLRAFLDEFWPGEFLASDGWVSVGLEVTREGLDEVAAKYESRADIVIWSDEAVVVIENKVDAGEGITQCERLYWSWAAESANTRYLFLSPTGRPPTTATSLQAIAAWHTASYADVAALLRRTLAEAELANTELGRASALNYLESISAIARH